ncbi:MAG TPA: bifunctional 3-phenylpropionate/cinnamic acid dioxygenase ferredoxin subunit [Candidatus Binataceae bacterium]|jgi:nitrite reductase/ring-hydroxylating ferredoxin subunit|nr:bifunctional 3-phenylpropionate/cinnamic acid dioxygenase ferredoxin subunit [Candidatus Binataceae bacterium]
MPWKKVCRTDEIADQSALKIKGDNPIAVFRVGNEFFVTDDTCTHAKFSLADGYIEGDEVVCALHEARFCLRTGRVLTPPATVPLRTYPVRIEGGEVFIELA